MSLAAELHDDAPVCPLSGAPMAERLTIDHDWRRPFDTRHWSIWWSGASSFGQIFPRPEADEIPSYYDVDSYYTHAERYIPDDEREARQVGFLGRVLVSVSWRFDHGVEPTREWWQSVIPRGAKRSLEIGCGDGDRMRTFGPLVDKCSGVEPDPAALRVALQRGLDVHAGTAEDLPEAIKAHKYDHIVFSHVLEHTLDPVRALTNAAELMAPGALLSCEVPNNECHGAQMMGPGWRWLDAPRHLNFFTEASLRACAEAAGLVVEKVLYRGYVRQFIPNWIVDESRIRAELENREMTQDDINAQLRHSVRLLAKTALAHPRFKYDSIRVLCRKA